MSNTETEILKVGGYIISESEYQGKPVLKISLGDKDPFPFTFGVGKALKVVAAMGVIEAFVSKHQAEVEKLTVERKAKITADIAKTEKSLADKQERLARLKEQALKA